MAGRLVRPFPQARAMEGILPKVVERRTFATVGMPVVGPEWPGCRACGTLIDMHRLKRLRSDDLAPEETSIE